VFITSGGFFRWFFLFNPHSDDFNSIDDHHIWIFQSMPPYTFSNIFSVWEFFSVNFNEAQHLKNMINFFFCVSSFLEEKFFSFWTLENIREEKFFGKISFLNLILRVRNCPYFSGIFAFPDFAWSQKSLLLYLEKNFLQVSKKKNFLQPKIFKNMPNS